MTTSSAFDPDHSETPMGLLLGVLALQKGFIEREQLDAALALQRRSARLGCYEPLGDVLVAEEAMTEIQVLRLLKIQELGRDLRRQLLLGKIALGEGYIDRAALDRALAEWRRRKYRAAMLDILLEQGALREGDRAPLQEIHEAVLADVGDELPLPRSAGDEALAAGQLMGERLGELALREGLVSLARLRDALQHQRQLLHTGLRRALEDILVDAGVLQAADAQRLRERIEEHAAIEIPGIELLDRRGQGQHGALYRARRRADGSLCARKGWVPLRTQREAPLAVKLLRASLGAGAGRLEEIEAAVRRAAGFTHPGTAALHEFGRTADGEAYVVSDWVDGRGLEAIVEHDGPLPPAQARALVATVAEAHAAALAAGLAPRDPGPRDVLLRHADRRPALTDVLLPAVRPQRRPAAGRTWQAELEVFLTTAGQ